MNKQDFTTKVIEIYNRNKCISQNDIISEKGLNYRLTYKYFGNFSDMCKELGFGLTSGLSKTSGELISIMSDIYNKNNNISALLIKADGRTSCDTIKRAFGSLCNGYVAAGISIVKGRKNIPKKEVDAEIFRIYSEYGYVSKPLIDKFSKINPKVIKRIYGSFANMYEALNIPRHRSGIIPSDDDIVNECIRLYNEYGYLSYDIVDKFGIISTTCLKDRVKAKNWNGINHYREIVGCPLPKLDWCESPEARRAYDMYCEALNEIGVKEKKFEWLKYNNKSLRVDMLFERNKIAIEYNGPQHYYIDGYYTKTQEELNRKQTLDQEKYRLLKEHGYKVIVIHFKDKLDLEYVNNTISN